MGGPLEPRLRHNHAPVETEGAAVMELRDGLVSRCRQFYDTAQGARQLGAAPPRGSRLEKIS
jgi:ketosteroid isomerase-like protein